MKFNLVCNYFVLGEGAFLVKPKEIWLKIWQSQIVFIDL